MIKSLYCYSCDSTSEVYINKKNNKRDKYCTKCNKMYSKEQRKSNELKTVQKIVQRTLKENYGSIRL